jgi:hypothetical protein
MEKPVDAEDILAYSSAMIGFLIKKTFFDLWDNLVRIILVNLGFILSAAIPLALPTLLVSIPPLSVAVLVIGILWCCVYLVTTSLTLKSISDNEHFGFKDFFGNIREAFPAGLMLGGFVCAIVLLVTTVIPFYLQMGSIFGLLLSAIIFWTLVIGVLSLQFFSAIRTRLDHKLTKVIKKCFIFFFDNPGFSIFCFIHNVALMALSVLLAFMVPGPAGILLFLDEGVRLRLLKYDWIEANPTENRRKVPWDSLLIDERERTGSRSLRNFIFPWKD